MRAYLGAKLVRSLKPADKPFEVRDSELGGFLLRIQPSGRMAWYVELGRGRRKRIGPAPALTPEGARTQAKVLLGRAAAGEDVIGVARAEKAAALTLADFLRDTYGPWVQSTRKDGEATLARLLACFVPPAEGEPKGPAGLFAGVRLSAVSPFLVERWRSARLKAGIRPTTVNRDLGALKAALARAVEWGKLDEHPLKPVKPTRVDDRGRVRFLSADEEARLREALAARDERGKRERASANAWRRARGYESKPELGAYADHLTPAVLVSLNTGCRRGELLSLTWGDVALDRASLHVRGETAKSSRTRHVPLNREALDVLRRWRAQSVEGDPAPEALVFPARGGGRLDNIKKSWGGVLRAAGIRGFRWHDLRHHFASALVMRGADLYALKELLGHSTIAMTEKYAHLAPEHKRGVVALLDSPQPSARAGVG